MKDANHPTVHRGLKDMCFDRSPTTLIDGRAGELRYRGYSIHDLAAHSSFEETAYLLLHGELPTASEFDAFDAALKEARSLPGPVYDIIRAVKDSHPMDVLRTAVSALAAFDPETGDNSLEATRRKGIRLTSQAPMVVTRAPPHPPGPGAGAGGPPGSATPRTSSTCSRARRRARTHRR